MTKGAKVGGDWVNCEFAINNGKTALKSTTWKTGQ
jgi:hypothetical protein